MKKFGISRHKGDPLRIDSPGGACPEPEITKKSEKSGRTEARVSPWYTGASGGYYVACGASRIVANRGRYRSIGVISEFLSFRSICTRSRIKEVEIRQSKTQDHNRR